MVGGMENGNAPSLTRAQAVAHTAMVREKKERSRVYRWEQTSAENVGQWK